MDKEKLDMILDCIFMCILIMSCAYCTAKTESAKATKTVIVEACNK